MLWLEEEENQNRKIMLHLLKPFVHDAGDVIGVIGLLTLLGAMILSVSINMIRKGGGEAPL